MGKLFSKCIESKRKPRLIKYQTKGHVFPFPCNDNITDSSEHNDDKFYFVKNQPRIDGIISYLDELQIASEDDVAMLEQTLSELRTIKQLHTSPSSYNTFDRFLMVSERTMEKKDMDDNEDLGLDRDDVKYGRASTQAYSLDAKDLTRQTILLMEIQKASFLHPKLLEKYRLSRPYLVSKIYLKTNKDPFHDIWSEVKQFETPKEAEVMKPEWNHMIEYYVEDSEKTSVYSVGISLFYISDNDESIFQIGEEQIFPFSVLLDQKVQVKQIDFKDPVLKGVLAKLKVRFQLVYNMEEVRGKNLRDIKTRIERLIKIRERHANLFPDKLDFASYSNSGRNGLSQTGSLGSTSSLHDNGETDFYVV